ncbi:uncharacterized protein LOC131223909 [Magnolia sinica]|uniref:uncharacterized protein LOC131223909 n=1 Tax=Magnolia sinica TaxID=86752 RepID=UPI00265A22FA|nr:uncharacterized protein LOC131223909 [Magnolia sinica]
MRPFPTIEQVAAHVRRKAIRQTVMTTSGHTETPGAVLASKSFRPRQSTPPSTESLSLDNGKTGMPSKPRASSDGVKCSHCGNLKHTRDTCFKLHGYLNWWNELQARKHHDGEPGKVAVATAEPSLSLETSQGDLPITDPGYSYQGDHWAWY